VEAGVEPHVVSRPTAIVTVPATDVAFRAYAQRALARMPEPTADGLALRLRRLYPHAAVREDRDAWIAERDPNAAVPGNDGWWRDERLPRVRYDAQALILEANAAARELLGPDLVGRYWQDLVTPGSTDEVAVMLAILSEAGGAESRFRMPRADGRLVEFDSYTAVTGEEFVTVMKPAEA
jgi:PAS domain-containing protein